MQSKFIEINQNKYFVRTWGTPNNPKILLLHGFPEYSGAWEPLADHLKKDFYLIAPDQRGFGQSWGPLDEKYYKTASIINDLEALIKYYGKNIIVLGHDWGAAVAYALAFSKPKIINKLIILNGVHPAIFQQALLSNGLQTKASQYINFLREKNVEIILKKDNFKKLIELFATNMDTSWLEGQTKTNYISEWSRENRLKTMLNWYRASPLVVPKNNTEMRSINFLKNKELSIKCPHLLIWGERDTALLPESFSGLENYCLDLEIFKLPNADHWLHHQEPKKISRIIAKWVLKKRINNT